MEVNESRGAEGAENRGAVYAEVVGSREELSSSPWGVVWEGAMPLPRYTPPQKVFRIQTCTVVHIGK